MPLYSVLMLLHGYVHNDPESLALLARNRYLVIPFINVDGSYVIYEQYMKTGELILKRKNNDLRFEKESNLTCPLWAQGVDINRNYGVHFGNNDTPCGEAYPGPHAFSEPETKAMRALLTNLQDDIKFVYNFHAYGPMYIWPYNGEKENTLHEQNPEAELIFNEIWDEATFPASTLRGNAIKTVGYISNGEGNDYIMKTFNIPSVSPELASDDFFSTDFFLPYDFVTRGVLRQNYPWIKHTFKKLAGEIEIDPMNNATFQVSGGRNVTLKFDVKNIGLQDWNMTDEGQNLVILDSSQTPIASVDIPNIPARKSVHLNVTFDGLNKQLSFNGHDLGLIFAFKKYASDYQPTLKVIEFAGQQRAPQMVKPEFSNNSSMSGNSTQSSLLSNLLSFISY